MNRLLDKAPKTVMVGGVECEIFTNFYDCLFTIIKLKDPNFTPEEKIEILINNMYPEDPPDIGEAVEKALWFLRCGAEYKENNRPVLCDFEQDGDYIYKAFLKTNINLDSIDYMHWWEFMARFSELPESFFGRIVYLRSQRNNGKLSKAERKECERIGWDVINIKEPETPEEQIAGLMFNDYFQDG